MLSSIFYGIKGLDGDDAENEQLASIAARETTGNPVSIEFALKKATDLPFITITGGDEAKALLTLYELNSEPYLENLFRTLEEPN